jgi:hypothetical protein
VTWSNPFVYFHAVIDKRACGTEDVDLSRLASDLSSKRKAPSFAYIVPDRCHDGSDQACAPGAPSGLAAAEPFLRSVVPEIEHSPAYKAGGLIAITFDQAPQSGPFADPSACCDNPTYPNVSPAAVPMTTPSPISVGPTTPTGGGGQVGLLLISQFVKPGSVENIDFYNHFSLLASIEDLFGVHRLGYAKDPQLPVFDAAVYNAYKPK